MKLPEISNIPKRQTYDVVIVGGAIMGASVASFLAQNKDFGGSILVVERDLSFENSSTAHSNSCMRQQFSSEINVRVSQFTAEYVRDFAAHMGDARVPEVFVHPFGYLYLAGDAARVTELAANQQMQARLGAGTRLLSPEELAQDFPFFNLEGIMAGSFNPVDEGYFDGGLLFDWWRRLGRERGVEYLHEEITGLSCDNGKVTGVTLSSGATIGCGVLVNAAGPRAALVAAMAGLDLPVEPRKRFTWVVEAAEPLAQDLPLTVDPSGVHIRTDGKYYMIGAAPNPDPAVDPEDLQEDFAIWEEHVWPVVAQRIPQFDRLRVINSWAGHYAYNTIDQNAVLGPHPDLDNFLFINGFSGHGLQQAPAMGRGLSEWITSGCYQSLDLSAFAYERLRHGGAPAEQAVI